MVGPSLAVPAGMMIGEDLRERIETTVYVGFLVLAALSITVAVVRPVLSRGCRYPPAAQTRTAGRTLIGAAEMYMAQHSRCPTLTELAAEGFINANTRVVDAWDSPFRVECEGGEVRVTSPGPDGQHGTEDDIGS